MTITDILMELFIGQIPEAIYFALFMIFVKNIHEKRFLFTILMIVEYLLLVRFIHYNIWFQITYTFISYIILKMLYKDRAQIIDIFTFTIGSIILTMSSIIAGLILMINPVLGIIMSRILPLCVLCFGYKLYNIQNLYKHLWNRNDAKKKKIKSTTFRSVNVVIFNLMFYIINIFLLYGILRLYGRWW